MNASKLSEVYSSLYTMQNHDRKANDLMRLHTSATQEAATPHPVHKTKMCAVKTKHNNCISLCGSLMQTSGTMLDFQLPF